MSETGVSIAMVFRSVKTTGVFNKENNCWMWENDSTYKKDVEDYWEITKVARSELEQSKLEQSKPEVTDKIIANMERFLSSVGKNNK